ncbi:MAG TPA: carbohydrate-binding protein, partial [Chryseosolibacter sp.]|nr:carbohydrate-binding protein [Chryseosolibacter sp.]
YNGIFPTWDNNMVASFHKYWNHNDPGSIQGFINIRDQQNIPIWLGESGENSNVWFRNAIALMESDHIGWAWWPMKKIGSVVNPLTVKKNAGYQDLLNYWKNGGAKPSVETARAALFELTENLRIENCIYRKDVTDAMIRQITEERTIPYAAHKIPGLVHLTDFDLGRHNKAYADKDTANYHVASGNYTAWNNGWNYRNDAVDIEATKDTDSQSNGFNIGWTNDGEWMAYTVTVDSTAAYAMTVRYASSAAAKVRLLVNGVEKTKTIDLAPSGGFQVWANKVVDDVTLYRGKNKLILYIEKGGMNLGYMRFHLSKQTSAALFEAVAAQTTKDGMGIVIALNKNAASAALDPAAFAWSANGVVHTIREAAIDPDDNSRLLLKTDHAATDKDLVRVRYNGQNVKSTDQTSLQHFTDLPVRNMVPLHWDVPGLVEAEKFNLNVGFGVEPTTDAGGGENLGYTNANDYAEYLISVQEKTTYRAEVRVASMSQGGKIKIQQLSQNGTALNSVEINVPVTGGWQTWQTVSEKITLDAGRTILRVTVVQPGFNLNWLKFAKEVITDAERDDQGNLYVYPNPVNDFLKLELPSLLYSEQNSVQIRSLCGRVISRKIRLTAEDFNRLYVGNFPAGQYIVEISFEGKMWTKRFVIQ